MSAFYEGTVQHRRFAVREHTFRHRISMAYVDLDDVPSLLGRRSSLSVASKTFSPSSRFSTCTDSVGPGTAARSV